MLSEPRAAARAGGLWRGSVVVIAHLAYLLLPFGVGVLSSLAAAAVALALLAQLMRWLVWRPLRDQSVLTGLQDKGRDGGRQW